MSSNSTYYGICITCNNAPYCRLSRDSDHPVWFCEMFNDFDRSANASLQPNIPEKHNVDEINITAEKSDPKYKGLCSNCACRETCTFPKPDGGVWHCSEYC